MFKARAVLSWQALAHNLQRMVALGQMAEHHPPRTAAVGASNLMTACVHADSSADRRAPMAISNSRLISMDEHGITFRWKEYRAKAARATRP
jgi:hypothetical protein